MLRLRPFPDSPALPAGPPSPSKPRTDNHAAIFLPLLSTASKGGVNLFISHHGYQDPDRPPPPRVAACSPSWPGSSRSRCWRRLPIYQPWTTQQEQQTPAVSGQPWLSWLGNARRRPRLDVVRSHDASLILSPESVSWGDTGYVGERALNAEKKEMDRGAPTPSATPPTWSDNVNVNAKGRDRGDGFRNASNMTVSSPKRPGTWNYEDLLVPALLPISFGVLGT